MVLESGDHIWYYDGQGNENAILGEQTSTDQNIPRLQWFPNANPNDKNDYSGNGKHIFNFVLYDTEIRWGQPQLKTGRGSFAWLNNNPGNLTGTGQANEPYFGQFRNKFNGASRNFLIFPDRDTGFAAIAKFLLNPGGFFLNRSILEAFKKYAPASDGNNPDQYAADVAAAAGVTINTLIRDLNNDQMLYVQNKIEQIEGSIEGSSRPYNSPDIPEVIQRLSLEF